MTVLTSCKGSHKKQYVSTCEMVPYTAAQYGDNNVQCSSGKKITTITAQ